MAWYGQGRSSATGAAAFPRTGSSKGKRHALPPRPRVRGFIDPWRTAATDLPTLRSNKRAAAASRSGNSPTPVQQRPAALHFLTDESGASLGVWRSLVARLTGGQEVSRVQIPAPRPVFFLKNRAAPDIYTLSLHDALPI